MTEHRWNGKPADEHGCFDCVCGHFHCHDAYHLLVHITFPAPYETLDAVLGSDALIDADRYAVAAREVADLERRLKVWDE